MSAVLKQGAYQPFTPPPTTPPKPVKVSEFTDPSAYATNPVLAKAYVARRRVDALAMTAGGILVLPYAKVKAGVGGSVIVNEVHCENADCAVAYILARWW